jgi:hypothetical protein
MKKLVLLFAALLVAGCGEKEQSALAPEAKPVEPVAEAESPTKSEPKSKAMKANLLKGKWIEFGDTVRGGPETWEFHENGTVDIIDEGKKMAGKYEVTPPDTVSMTVFGMTISAKISKSGDEITSAVGKYKKEGNYQAEAKPVEPVAEAAKPKPPTAKAPDISIYDAAGDGNIEAVKQHIAAGTNVDTKQIGSGGTPLYWAASYGHKEIVELLIAEGADVNANNLYTAQTPLHDAAAEGHKEVAELLIANGADVNAKSDEGETPIDMAIRLKQTKIADLLRKHGGKTGEELKAEGQ